MPIETSDDRGFEWCDVCGELLYTKPGPHRCPGAPDRVESPKAARRLSQVVLEPGYERRDKQNGVPMSAIETTGELLDAATERDALKAKLVHVEGMVAAVFRDYQIESDESLREVVARLAEAAERRTLKLEECRAKLAEAEAAAECARIDEGNARVAWASAVKNGDRAARDALEAYRLQCELTDDHRARLTACEKVVESAREWSDAVERGFASQVRPDIARARFLTALRALDAAKAKDSDSSVGGAATAEGPGPGPLCAQCGAPIGYCRDVCGRERQLSVSNGQTPEPAGTTATEEWTTNDDLNADACEGIAGATPATLSDLSALEERIVERVRAELLRAAKAFAVATQYQTPKYNAKAFAREYADELRRKP